jgi:hypothetical protein
VGPWLAYALCALAPEHEGAAGATRADGVADIDGERLALAPRTRPSPDLKDPFLNRAPAEHAPFRPESASDLKDPFGQPREPGPHASIRTDLIDPFGQDGSPAGCSAPETTADGILIQRPRTLEHRRTCTRTISHPLRDPFSDD